jgi:hypothetical protein
MWYYSIDTSEYLIIFLSMTKDGKGLKAEPTKKNKNSKIKPSLLKDTNLQLKKTTAEYEKIVVQLKEKEVEVSDALN